MASNKKLVALASLILNVITMGGCAVIDEHLYDPAASHARVDPLFRTAECQNYRAPDGQHWGKSLLEGSTRNISSLFFKDTCGYQARSIVEFSGDPKNQGYDQYLNYCINNLSGQETKDQEALKAAESNLTTDKAKAEFDKSEADLSLTQANQNQAEADIAKANAAKDKSSASIAIANKLQTQADASKLLADANKATFQKSQLAAKASELKYNTLLDRVNGSWQSKSISCLKYLTGKSDEICEIHKSHIYGNRAATNTTLQVLATGAGIAGAMTGVGAAAPLLSGSAGFLTGTQAIMDKEVYLNTVTQAVIQEINTNREKFLNTKLADYEKSTRPLYIGEIRADAIDYHNKCSFYDGLLSLINGAGDKKVVESNPALDRLISQKAQLTEKITQIKTELSTITVDQDRIQKEALLKSLENELKFVDVVIASITAPKPKETSK